MNEKLNIIEILKSDEKLSNAMRQVGSVADGTGMSLEETVEVLQFFFNAGFAGQKAGRALKSALADIASP